MILNVGREGLPWIRIQTPNPQLPPTKVTSRFWIPPASPINWSGGEPNAIVTPRFRFMTCLLLYYGMMQWNVERNWIYHGLPHSHVSLLTNQEVISEVNPTTRLGTAFSTDSTRSGSSGRRVPRCHA